MTRARALEELAGRDYDLLVIGAGIIGSRVAYEAARSGCRVALVDAGDFGGATSSASSKLIHGGLRYLPMGDLGLVREAHRERNALLNRVAPHLVRRLAFLLPIYRDGPHRAPVVAAGLLLYSALSSFRRTRAGLISSRRAHELVPPLRLEGLGVCGLYEDAQTHDSRLVLATVSAARQAGATVLNHAAVVGLDGTTARLRAAQVAVDGQSIEARFSAVVNASGPWVDRVRRLEDATCRSMARLSKGVHVTLPLDEPWRAALTVPVDRGRVAFAIPWEGILLLGTTDTPYDHDPDRVAAAEDDIRAVLEEAAVSLPAELLRRERVRYAFAGLRVLPMGEGDTARALREHVVRIGPRAMVSVAGGKLTTHRRIALDVLRHLHLKGVSLSDDPLPGAGPLPTRPSELEPRTWEHLTHLYGSEVNRVLSYRDILPEAFQRIHPAGPDIWAQAHFAVEHEWAVEVEDIARRRTTLEVRGLAGEDVRARLASLLRGRSDRPIDDSKK